MMLNDSIISDNCDRCRLLFLTLVQNAMQTKSGKLILTNVFVFKAICANFILSRCLYINRYSLDCNCLIGVCEQTETSAQERGNSGLFHAPRSRYRRRLREPPTPAAARPPQLGKL